MERFNGCLTPDTARQRYAELIQAGEPLLALTSEYLEYLKQFDGKTYTVKPDNGPSFDKEFKLNKEHESKYGDVISALHSSLPEVSLILRGSWLWIENTARTMAPKLKELAPGCTFNARRTKETGRGIWNWTPAGTRRRAWKSKKSYEDIGRVYGEERV